MRDCKNGENNVIIVNKWNKVGNDSKGSIYSYSLTIVGLIGSFMQIPLIGDIIEPFIYITTAVYVGYSIFIWILFFLVF